MEGYLSHQGTEPYREANNRLLGLFLPQRPVDSERSLHSIILALYNLDRWREQVGQDGFGARVGFSAEEVREALATDEALLQLGEHWLKRVL